MASTTMHGIRFRNKFLKKLSETGVAESIIATAFSVAMGMDENPFFWLLWKLCFEPCKEKALGQLWLTTNVDFVSEELEFIPDELVRPLRNELRYQYQQVHKSFLEGYDSNNEELYKAMEQDIILTAGIRRRLFKYLMTHSLEDRSNVIFLLNSDKENNVFGGLRKIGFTKAEAEVFLPKAGVIASTFEKMVADDAKTQKHLEQKGAPMTSKPFAGLGELIGTSTLSDAFPEDEEPQNEEPSQDEAEETTSSKLDARVVLDNIKCFEQFYGAVSELRKAGIDPFAALEEETKIQALISSVVALS